MRTEIKAKRDTLVLCLFSRVYHGMRTGYSVCRGRVLELQLVEWRVRAPRDPTPFLYFSLDFRISRGALAHTRTTRRVS